MQIPAIVLPHVRRVHDALAHGSLSQGELDRPVLKDVLARLRSYPGRPTIAPDDAYETAEAFRVMNSEPPEMAIEFDVWMDGMRSDLRAYYRVVLWPGQPPSVLLDDLRVP